MSILLDALKKSERRQRLGQVPTLEAESPRRNGPREPARAWVYLAISVPVFLAVAWLTWGQYRTLDGMPAIATQAGPDETGETGSVAAVPPRDEPRTPVETMDDKPAEPTADAAADDTDGAAETVAAADRVVPDPRPQPARQQETQQNVREESGIVGYWELPARVRDEFSEITISVLVYSDDPDQRFVLANGKRLRQGDALESRLIVHHIRRDGVVFRYGAYRFLVEP